MYTFEINGVVYTVESSPLNCGLSDHNPMEKIEKVSCYAESNVNDNWRVTK